MNPWQPSLLELIRRTSTDLPQDVEAMLRNAHRRETRGSPACWALDTILRNITLARQRRAPLCQDTGALVFYCRVPTGFDTAGLFLAIRNAVARATRLGYLRQNTIHTLTGSPIANNIGAGMPVVHFEFSRQTTLGIRLLLKGGGSENMSTQYSLPDPALKAARDWNGVRRCVLDTLVQAQGNGCAPGILGVCIGGDRATGAEHAKYQLLRPLKDHAPDAFLAALERRILQEANGLKIGPMGLGGRTTLLGVKVGALDRLPACYFVSVAYMCWAFRRRGVVLRHNGSIQQWLYE